MPCVSSHRSVRLRPHIILLEVGALIFALTVIVVSNPSLPFWLVGVMLLLLHTILFYRLGRISETVRTSPSPGFIRELRQMLTGKPQ